MLYFDTFLVHKDTKIASYHDNYMFNNPTHPSPTGSNVYIDMTDSRSIHG